MRLAGAKPESGTSALVDWCANELPGTARPVGLEGRGSCIVTKDTGVLGIIVGHESGQVGIWPSSPQKQDGITSPAEVHAHQCMQHGQQTVETRSHCAVRKTML